jgi:hypothetical protein
MFLIYKLELEVKVQSLELKVEMLQMLDFQVKKRENEYLKNLKDRYSDVKGRKGLTNKELAIKFYGEDTEANVAEN